MNIFNDLKAFLTELIIPKIRKPHLRKQTLNDKPKNPVLLKSLNNNFSYHNFIKIDLLHEIATKYDITDSILFD